ncbi:MAG: hybrid sensor histidine kinase/response regulator [Myxococcota bacterium]
MVKRGFDGEDLAASIHEATNALTVVLGWIERAHTAPDEGARDRALQRAATHARQARDAMRLSIGGDARAEPLTPSRTAPTTSAQELATRVVEDLTSAARDAAVHLRLSGAARGAIRDAQPAWQVLTNLVLNAIAMTPPAGAIDLRVSDTEDGAALRFDVHDEGPGVPATRRQTVFEGGRGERPGGTGIGLRHARQLATRHGGALTLEDSDGGAHFALRWPAAPETPREEAPLRAAARARSGPRPVSSSLGPTPTPREAVLQGARVLVLEDDAAVVELLEMSLIARGADVTSVRDAHALDVELEQGAGGYDVLLVDLSPLTEQKGGVVTEDEGLDQALDKARRRHPGIRVVVISGSVTVAPREDIIWVRKPFAFGEIVDAIAGPRSGP